MARVTMEVLGALFGIIPKYRPELHYMRGPGPKWREAHSSSQQQDGGSFPRVVADSDPAKVAPDSPSKQLE